MVGVSSLPKTVTRQRRDCDLNRGLSAPWVKHANHSATEPLEYLMLPLTVKMWCIFGKRHATTVETYAYRTHQRDFILPCAYGRSTCCCCCCCWVTISVIDWRRSSIYTGSCLYGISLRRISSHSYRPLGLHACALLRPGDCSIVYCFVTHNIAAHWDLVSRVKNYGCKAVYCMMNCVCRRLARG